MVRVTRAHTENRSPQNNNNDIEHFVSYINIGRNETAERMGRAGKLRETGACALLSAGTRSFGRELSRCVNLEQLLHDIPPSRSSRPHAWPPPASLVVVIVVGFLYL